MLWFDGSIKSAVDKVKSSGVFLLVFVQGNDSLSEKYEVYLNEKAVFNSEDYVPIKIPHDSVALQQFKQIYKIIIYPPSAKKLPDVSVPVPSVFIIQNNGIPLKVISSEDTSDINNAINDAINKQKLKQEKKQKVLSTNESISSSIVKNNADASAELSHVKNIGRKLFDVSEDEIKTRLKEIRAFPKFLLIDSMPDSTCHSLSPSKTHSARLQFRLPNNSMPSWEFPDLSTLADVRAYLTEKMKLSPNFKLLKTYPRYAFTPEDENKTLAALSLIPSAALIVVPVEDKNVQVRVTDLLVHQNFLSALLNILLKPLSSLLGFFKKLFWTKPSANKMPEGISGETDFDRSTNKSTSMTRSNIHGFKFDEDEDTDTEHPDNGNSTQQRFQ